MFREGDGIDRRSFIAKPGTSGGRRREPELEPGGFGPEPERRAWRAYREDLERNDLLIDHSHFFEARKLKLAHPKKKVIKVFHDPVPSPEPPPRASYDILAGVSRWHSQFLSRRWRTGVTSLVNGIPVDTFSFSSRKSEFILYRGSMSAEKGADQFPVICGRVGEMGVMAGEDSLAHGIEGTFLEKVLRKSRENGVEFLGRVCPTRKRRLLRDAKAIVVPLRPPYYEAFGLFIVEALASGTPVFTTDRGAPSEIITHRTGLVAKNVGGLVDGLRHFFSGRRDFDSAACRRRARRFDTVPMIDMYLEAIRAICPDRQWRSVRSLRQKRDKLTQ